MKPLFTALAAAALLAAGSAHANLNAVSGHYGGMAWTASSSIVGVTSTASTAGGGDPLYFAPRSEYSGVATIITDYGAEGAFICSGTLLPNQRSILPAGSPRMADQTPPKSASPRRYS